MIEAIKVERTKPAPRRLNTRRRSSEWRSLFESMKIGDWFVVDKSERTRLGAASQAYMKGRYSLYLHPEKSDTYVFVKNK